jgi:release factor glutamine methyltransferase
MVNVQFRIQNLELKMAFLRFVRKRILGSWLQARERKAMQRTRKWEWGGLNITIEPGVFHPGLFQSTLALIEVMGRETLAEKKFLEVGCGSGLISVWAAKQGASVTAIDISLNAVSCARQNAINNQVVITVLESDLFTEINKNENWDLLAVNPPYYPAAPKAEWEHAWFCGPELEYFQRFFAGLPLVTHSDSKIFMVLSEDCDLAGIQKMGLLAGYKFLRVHEVKKAGELTVVWRIWV